MGMDGAMAHMAHGPCAAIASIKRQTRRPSAGGWRLELEGAARCEEGLCVRSRSP